MEDQEKILLKVAQLKWYMIHATRNNNIDKKSIELILQGSNLNSVTVPNTNYLKQQDSQEIVGDSVLHLAFKESESDIFNILINNDADFNVKNKKGNTVLHEVFHDLTKDATSANFKEMENEFIESTLSAHVKYQNAHNPSDLNGITHFHIACAVNHIEAVQFFLRNGVPVNQTVTGVNSSKLFEGCTPLHIAAHFSCVEVTEILLMNGANVLLKDAKDKTALHICLEKNIAFIDSAGKAYLPNKFETNIELNEKISTLLQKHHLDSKFLHLCVASAMKNSCEVGKLLTPGIDLNQCISMDSQIWPGYSPLHFAAHVNVDTVKLLITHGANLMTKEANDVTPFDMCIDRYKVEDIFYMLCSVPSWKDIVLSDAQTKLVDLIFALRNSETVKAFLQESVGNVKLHVPLDSPLWPGFTLLHLAVLLTERKKSKTDYEYTEGIRSTKPDLSVITECLNQDADVTVKDHRSWTPIHFAFRLEKLSSADLLMQYHHKIDNCVDEDNLSHLHIACASGNRDVVKKLLWNNADVNIVYKGDSVVSSLVYPGWTPLHVAVSKRDCETAKLLLKFGGDAHTTDSYGFTPVHGCLSIYSWPNELSQVLFNAPNWRDSVVEDVGLSYLHVACSNGHFNAVKMLLDSGADINRVITCRKSDDSKNYPFTSNLKHHDGCTPLNIVSSSYPCSGILKIMSLLIERGADVFIKDSHGVSPLRRIVHSQREIAEYMRALQSNFELQKRMEAEVGLTMLHLACSTLEVDLIKDLLNNGADVNAQTHENWKTWPKFTCLHALVYRDCLYEEDDNVKDVVKLLFDRNADVTLADADNDTPLHAVYRDSFENQDIAVYDRLSWLLKGQKNFEVNPKSFEGFTHFHIACHMLDVDVVEKFLEHGVDVNARIDLFCGSENIDVAGSTPLHLAIRGIKSTWEDSSMSLSELLGQLKIVDSLIKHGADVNIADINGNTPAHHAGSCNYSKGNLLQRLANGGADLNAVNVRGEAPLEMLLRKKPFIPEEVRYFVTLGCRLNAFNAVTEEGYMAKAGTLLAHEDMQLLLCAALVNAPDMVAADHMNRTAIHNVVSIVSSKVTDVQYVDFFDAFEEFGCDIDGQDDSGRTALHLAALFRNESAVEGLLLAGADMNVVDRSGKTAFDYVFEPCVRRSVNSKSHDQFSHVKLFNIFMLQTKKMEFSNIYVSASNAALLNKAVERFDSQDIADDLNDFLEQFGQIVPLTLEPYPLTAGDFVSKAAAVINYPLMPLAKREAIDAFFRANKKRFQEEFKAAAGIFQLQYRQAVLRRNIIHAANDSLSLLMGQRLPDICSHMVLGFLENFELKNLISSAA